MAPAMIEGFPNGGEGNALIAIRDEHPADVAGIRELNKRAFGQDQEANLVDALRSHGAVLLSLVATLDGRVLGHIMYSPVFIGGNVAGAALAYRPEFSSVS